MGAQPDAATGVHVRDPPVRGAADEDVARAPAVPRAEVPDLEDRRARDRVPLRPGQRLRVLSVGEFVLVAQRKFVAGMRHLVEDRRDLAGVERIAGLLELPSAASHTVTALLEPAPVVEDGGGESSHTTPSTSS
jgi:hypothetical protein